MITTIDLERMDASLRVYDIYQGAWEQEPNGFESNTRHLLTHLAKDLAGKDFADDDLVRTAIAPDSVQYGLRLGRWAGVSIDHLARIKTRDQEVRSKVEVGLKDLPWGLACFVGATGILAQHLHDLDHAKNRDEALSNRSDTVGSAARLLIHSASIQAHQIGFPMTDAFDDRITFLRKRFGIPEPDDE